VTDAELWKVRMALSTWCLARPEWAYTVPTCLAALIITFMLNGR
jgi:hypothetical protein